MIIKSVIILLLATILVSLIFAIVGIITWKDKDDERSEESEEEE